MKGMKWKEFNRKGEEKKGRIEGKPPIHIFGYA